jgi:hypothetical protein
MSLRCSNEDIKHEALRRNVDDLFLHLGVTYILVVMKLTYHRKKIERKKG